MTVHTAPAGAPVHPNRVTRDVGVARIQLPRELLLEIVTGLAQQCAQDGRVLEQLVELGSAVENLDNRDLRLELGQDALDGMLCDAQAPFADLTATWGVPLSEARALGMDLLKAYWADEPTTAKRTVCRSCGINPAAVDEPYCLSCEERVAS